MGLFNNFPYTNMHELNIDYIIQKVNELYDRGTTLYAQLEAWKDATDADLATWKATTLAAINQWETDLQTALDAWKTSTYADFEAQFDDFQDTLDGYVTTFEQIQTAAAAAATSAAASADNAEDAAQVLQNVQDDIYEYGYKHVDTDSIADTAPWGTDGCSANRTTTKISTTPNTSYYSLTFVTSGTFKFYVDLDDYPGTQYFSICYGTAVEGEGWETITGTPGGYQRTCTDTVRLRKSDNNLPDSEHPLTLAAGTVVVITVSRDSDAGTHTTPYVYMYGPIPKYMSKNEGMLQLSRPDASTVVISSSRYQVTFSKVASTQGYLWNITDLRGPGASDGLFPSTVDIIGPIQFEGASRPMGGVHGNENCVAFAIMAAGLNAPDGYYPLLHMAIDSDLYDVNNPDTVVCKRRLEFVFTEIGWTCRNTFQIVQSATVAAAYCGLFYIDPAQCRYVYTNMGTVDTTDEVPAGDSTYYPYRGANFKEATIQYTNNITVNLLCNDADTGWIQYRRGDGAYKIYFAKALHQLVNPARPQDFSPWITGLCEYRF